MSDTSSGSEDITSLKDQVNSSSLEETNSPRKCGGSRTSLKKGPWTCAEDAILIEYVRTYGEGNWNAVWKKSGLSRCGKSCRLRWANHLRPNIKKGGFTSEEERLIIELHSKFGNKWARMSAHLPGRTDNEIKNYWNMRVKRRQHAGLPLYPPDLCLQTLNESLQVQTSVEFNNHEPHNQGVEENNYEIPDLTFDHFEENQGLVSLPPILADISLVSSMLSEDPNPSPSQNYGLHPSTPRAKRLRSDTFLPDFSFDTNEFAQFDHFLSSMPSSSTPPCKLPLGGSLELELSSLQQPNPVQPTSLDYIDLFLQAPSPIQAPSAPILSDCSSPRKSELLDTLLYDAQILNNTMKQSSEKLSTSCIGTPTDKLDSSCMILSQPGWEEFVGPIYPLDNFDPIVCTKRVPITGATSSQEQQAPKELTGSYVDPEPVEQVACLLNGRKESTESNKSDALLDMGWYEIDECFKDQSNVLYDLSTLLGEEICSEYEGNMVGTGTTSTLSGEWGCVSSLWNNMS